LPQIARKALFSVKQQAGNLFFDSDEVAFNKIVEHDFIVGRDFIATRKGRSLDRAVRRKG